MKVFRIILAGVILVGCAVTAQAIVQPSTLETYDDGCVVNGSTAGCFSYSNPTSTGFSGPTTTACTAKASNNARCRTCAEAYYDNGQPKGYSVCSYTTLSAQCACSNANTKNCAGTGSCTYHPAL